MNDFISKMTKVARETSQNTQECCFIFMKVTDIKTETSGLTLAYGRDILTHEYVSVRLSSIDETAADLKLTQKHKSLETIKKEVTSKYTGRNSRETLDKKRDKRNSAFLLFERCYPLEGQSTDRYKPYRSHWSKTISPRNDIEFITGMANITAIDERDAPAQNGYTNSGKILAKANVIQYVRYLELNQHETNLKMLTHALRNASENLLREGCVEVRLQEKDKTFASFTIKQAHILKKGINHINQPCEYTVPADVEESLAKFLAPHDRVTQFAVSKDIGRVVLHVFCGQPIDPKLFSSQDENYMAEMRKILSGLKNGHFKAKVIGMRVLRFGSEAIQGLVPNGRFDPLLTYKRALRNEEGVPTGEHTDLYLPTVFALMFAPHGRRLIIFKERMFANGHGKGRGCDLDEIDTQINGFGFKTIDPNTL